jgi:dipeptide/tripeptide permease
MWFYVVMNAGAILGPILYGVSSVTLGWRWGFLIASLLLWINLVYTCVLKGYIIAPQQAQNTPKHRSRALGLVALIIAGCLGIFYQHPKATLFLYFSKCLRGFRFF